MAMLAWADRKVGGDREVVVAVRISANLSASQFLYSNNTMSPALN
jgi:hypothetical protein